MYDWRKMTPEERSDALAARKARGYPWHRPPHAERGPGRFFLSAACFEHAPLIGHSPARMSCFEQNLLEVLDLHVDGALAWCILPNHYHALVDTPSLDSVLKALARFHGRTSYDWNGVENCRGRKVWYKCTDRRIRSERHYWSALNYIHHNPVRHGYVRHWQDWPYTSASAYLRDVGKEEAKRRWLEYPILDFGEGWDI